MTEHDADNREVEAKFDADPASREALLHLDDLDRFHIASRKMQRQDDIYFDTERGDLAAAGATLRVRKLADRAVMTFKGDPQTASGQDEEHVASRVEDEAPISAEQAAMVALDRPLPESIAASPLTRARAIVADASLLPIARLENERAVIDLVDAEGTHLELAVDHCFGARLRDGRVIEFHEVELELKKASRDELMALARALQQHVPSLRPSRQTKLERTMA